MKATLEFDLPRERQEFQDCSDGKQLRAALIEIVCELEKQDKDEIVKMINDELYNHYVTLFGAGNE